jgi:hypothetical protein
MINIKKFLNPFIEEGENKPVTVSDLLKKRDSDKVTRHSYGDFYNNLFSPFKNRGSVNILEVGTWRGSSVRVWCEYLPNSKVTGIDILDFQGEVPKNFTFIKADVKTIELSGDYDIIIGDSSHSLPEIMYETVNFTHHLKENGVFVIEDIQIPPEYMDAIRFVLPKGFKIETFDFRHINKRHDNFLAVITRDKND